MNTLVRPTLSQPLPSGFGLPAPAAKRNATANSRSTRRLLDVLTGLRYGQLTVQLPDGCHHHFGTPVAHEVPAIIAFHDESACSDILLRGDIGFGERYIDGAWSSPDLAHLLTLLNRNREPLRKAVYGNALSLLGERLRHFFRANSRSGSRRNIMAHYDLGNSFYDAWLDPSMSYSSALFTPESNSLETAQLAKYRRIVKELDLKPGDRVLEIGCGWGGFAEVAAKEAGAQVHGITLSPAQLAYAQARMKQLGLDGQVTLELRDYRDLTQQYDHIVSIEMFEAVGERWWPTYFQTLQRCLRPGGRALVQSITIDESLFDSYRRGTDFIQQHVFPGGMLPSPSAFRRTARQAGLTVDESFAFGFDYARTLALWQQTFNARWTEIAPLGFDERFHRLWNFYFAYCRAGFATGSTDVIQFRLQRPS